MKAWGFSKQDLWFAARNASARMGSGTVLCLRNVSEHGVRVPTISFILRFESSTKRLLKRERTNEAEYPPGVMVRPSYTMYRVLDAIPASELFTNEYRYRVEYRPTRRACGAPCWHTFGHFLRCAFEINPEGRIKTGLADYRGMAGFNQEYRNTDVEKGSPAKPLRYSEACDCYHYGVEGF